MNEVAERIKYQFSYVMDIQCWTHQRMATTNLGPTTQSRRPNLE